MIVNPPPPPDYACTWCNRPVPTYCNGRCGLKK